MPATVWFANGTKIKDSIKYKYDSCGNISEIIKDGELKVKYTYDQFNRLAKEENNEFNKTTEFEYDTNGNILRKSETKNGTTTTKEYKYVGDKLVSYDGEACEYNNLGNPTTYRGKVCEWQYGNLLTRYHHTWFTYDSLGRRTKKNGITYTYDSDGRLIAQSNGLEFIYDANGLAALKYNDEMYFYRKDAQGNIIAILNESSEVVVKYDYDAWGNCKALFYWGSAAGSYRVDYPDNDIALAYDPFGIYKKYYTIANLNPFRYRGYYYDTETKLYYLQTRYYDPEVGRFISQDSIEYADPEAINGLNLYAYCGNNPVMNVDPTGCSWSSFWNGVGNWFKKNWVKVVVGATFIVVGAVVTALTAGAGTPFLAAFGSALLSSTIQVGIGMVVSVGVNGLVNLTNGNSFFDNVGDTLADSFMWGGIFAGGAQILGGGFRAAANLGAQTGRKAGISLGKTGIKILSPDKNNWTKAGGTILKFGNYFRMDVGAHWGLHIHILNSGHLPIGIIIAALLGRKS